MPKENKLLFGLCDIKSVRFTCNDCGSVQAFLPEKWDTVPKTCVNSQAHKWVRDTSKEGEALTALRDALKVLLKLKDADGMTIQIEFDEEPGRTLTTRSI